jgi:hypothetical protein
MANNQVSAVGPRWASIVKTNRSSHSNDDKLINEYQPRKVQFPLNWKCPSPVDYHHTCFPGQHCHCCKMKWARYEYFFEA